MKAILIPFLSLLIPLTPQSAFAQSEPELKLESVVIVSRHGCACSNQGHATDAGCHPRRMANLAGKNWVG
ncbi:periplasmic AppA protein [includes: phosphoanhydrid phosphohydrolase and 4-phytase] [Escherichia coli]|nr:periplasmic AppA protein [includes: phosphoanhydrid phosphohydrolase and 4-phytase] [Escherichia coli]